MKTENQDLNVFQKFKRLFSSFSQISHIGAPCTYPDCSNMTSYKDIWRTRRENFSKCWDSFLKAGGSKFLSCTDLEQVRSFLEAHHDNERAAYFKVFPEQASPHVFIQYFIVPRLLSEVMWLHHCKIANQKPSVSAVDSIRAGTVVMLPDGRHVKLMHATLIEDQFVAKANPFKPDDRECRSIKKVSLDQRPDFTQMTLEEIKAFILKSLEDEPGFSGRYVDDIARVVFSVTRLDKAGDET